MSMGKHGVTACVIEDDENCVPIDPALRDVQRCGVMGGMRESPTWAEYLAMDIIHEPHALAIRECIEREGLVGVCANDWCNGHSFLVIEGDRRWVYGFSWRAWGDLMQAIVGKREGYMRYYYRSRTEAAS